MKIQYVRGERRESVDLLLVPVYKDWEDSALVKRLDGRLRGELSRRARKAGFSGKEGTFFKLQAAGAEKADQIVLWGLGDRVAPTPEALWDFAHQAAGKLRSPAVKTLALALQFEPGMIPFALTAKLAQGMIGGYYRFDRYKTEGAKENKKSALDKLLLWEAGKSRGGEKEAKRAIERGVILGEAVNLARDLVNEPAETLTPVRFAETARSVAKKAGFACRVEKERQIARRGMGLYMAVARGSQNPPRLVTLTYNPRGAKGRPVVWIGKGLMFDSGGYSLKPSEGMETMKCDMAGAAAVLAAMQAAARLKIKRKIVGVVAACENMIGPGSYRLGDVYTGMSGKTVEILNTDAEGRLTLADALTYAQSFKPEWMVDLATLTGACVVALGEETVGLFACEGEAAGRMEQAAGRAGEDIWRLPMNRRLKKQLKSDVADLKNVGNRWGGAITAALFLREFAGGIPWAHLDIAGPAFHKAEAGHLPKGGSGVGVCTLVELVDPSEAGEK